MGEIIIVGRNGGDRGLESLVRKVDGAGHMHGDESLEGRVRAALGATAVFAVGAGEEEGHVLAVCVEGEEAEVVGVEVLQEGAGGRAGDGMPYP